jgi:hypothetical protein
MIEELKDTPNTMVGFRVSKHVTKTEFDRVIHPAVHELIQRTGKLNYLFILDLGIINYSFGSWLEEVMLETKSRAQSRAAIVTAPGFSLLLKAILRRITPGEVKIFSDSELDDAILWASDQKSLSANEMVFQEEDDKRE